MVAGALAATGAAPLDAPPTGADEVIAVGAASVSTAGGTMTGGTGPVAWAGVFFWPPACAAVDADRSGDVWDGAIGA